MFTLPHWRPFEVDPLFLGYVNGRKCFNDNGYFLFDIDLLISILKISTAALNRDSNFIDKIYEVYLRNNNITIYILSIRIFVLFWHFATAFNPFGDFTLNSKNSCETPLWWNYNSIM